MFIVLIIISLLTRLALMPFFAHSDLFSINMFPPLLFEQSVFDILSYVSEKIGPAFQYYPPLTYYTFAVFHLTYQFFSDTFLPWMQEIRTLEINGVKGQVDYYIINAPNAAIFRDLFLAKIPYLIFEAGTIIALFLYLRKKLIVKWAIIIWLINPILLYSTYVFGQMEVIPTFFILLAFLVLRKNTGWAIFLLGIAAAYKNYAFIFIIPTILIYARSWRERLKLAVLALIPHLVFLLPTLVSNPIEAISAFIPRSFLIYKHPLQDWPLISQIARYVLTATSFVIIILISYFLKLKDKWRFAVGTSLAAMLLIITLAPRTHFHYLMWALPLLFLWYRNLKSLSLVILTLGLSFASYKILANHLQAGLLAPLDPYYFSNLPTFNAIIDALIPYRIISTIGFLIFTGVTLFLALTILKQLIFEFKTK